MKRWAKPLMASCLIGASSATAGDGPKLEPPARPTRSEVEGTPNLPLSADESAPGLGTGLAPRTSNEVLPPIYRPAPPIAPGLLAPRPRMDAQAPREVLPPALEGPRALTLEAVPDPSRFDIRPLPDPVKPTDRIERVGSLPKRIEPEPRRRGLFGLFRPEPKFERIEPAETKRPEPPSESPKPHSDPSVDTALRQKVMTQADRALGRHLRDLDVRVMDQKILIRAKPDFFWNKRALRKVLATLPAVRGHETTIEVD